MISLAYKKFCSALCNVRSKALNVKGSECPFKGSECAFKGFERTLYSC